MSTNTRDVAAEGKCPFCGAGIDSLESTSRYRVYTCMSASDLRDNSLDSMSRSHKCKDRQLAQQGELLREVVEILELIDKKYQEAKMALLIPTVEMKIYKRAAALLPRLEDARRKSNG